MQVSNCDKKLNASLFTVCGNLAVGLDGGAISGNRTTAISRINLRRRWRTFRVRTHLLLDLARSVLLLCSVATRFDSQYPSVNLRSQLSAIVSLRRGNDTSHNIMIHSFPDSFIRTESNQVTIHGNSL